MTNNRQTRYGLFILIALHFDHPERHLSLRVSAKPNTIDLDEDLSRVATNEKYLERHRPVHPLFPDANRCASIY